MPFLWSRVYASIFFFFQGLAFVTMMVHRLASAIGGDSTDDWTFVAFVVYSFFFIVLVQLIGILLGDRSPIQVPPLLPSESSNLCTVVHIKVNLFQKLATKVI